jgi:hypothetical protein
MNIKNPCLTALAAIGIAVPSLAGNQTLLPASASAWDYAASGPQTNYFGLFAYTNTYASSGGSPLTFLVVPNARAISLQISFDYCNTNAAGQTYVARFSSSLDMAHWVTNFIVCNIVVPQGTNTAAFDSAFDVAGVPYLALTSFESTNANTVTGWYTNGWAYPGATNGVPVVDYTNLTVKWNSKTGI